MWAVFVDIIYSTIGLKSEMRYYLIGNNMLDNYYLMYVYMSTLK